MKSNMQLLHVIYNGNVMGVAQYNVFVTYTGEDDRRSIIAQLEDNSEKSHVAFRMFQVRIITFYEPDTKTFRQKRVIDIKVAVPEEMDATALCNYVLDLIG